MALGCVTKGGIEPPNVIEDTSTLKITLDNQGYAILTITILTRNTNPITSSCYEYNLNGKKFRGFIDSDNPRKLEGSKYYEHNITAKGMIC
jgi:hypothetical protein